MTEQRQPNYANAETAKHCLLQWVILLQLCIFHTSLMSCRPYPPKSWPAYSLARLQNVIASGTMKQTDMKTTWVGDLGFSLWEEQVGLLPCRRQSSPPICDWVRQCGEAAWILASRILLDLLLDLLWTIRGDVDVTIAITVAVAWEAYGLDTWNASNIWHSLITYSWLSVYATHTIFIQRNLFPCKCLHLSSVPMEGVITVCIFLLCSELRDNPWHPHISKDKLPSIILLSSPDVSKTNVMV
jgi:hypothetical protein